MEFSLKAWKKLAAGFSGQSAMNIVQATNKFCDQAFDQGSVKSLNIKDYTIIRNPLGKDRRLWGVLYQHNTLGHYLKQFSYNALEPPKDMPHIEALFRYEGAFGLLIKHDSFVSTEACFYANNLHPYDKSDKPCLTIKIKKLDGKSLSSHKSEHLTVDLIYNVLETICTAVKYYHENHLILRDLKSSNIMVDDQLNVKVFDLGCTVPIYYRSPYIFGSVVAPEYISSSVARESNDIYRIGMIATSLLLGLTLYEVSETLKNINYVMWSGRIMGALTSNNNFYSGDNNRVELFPSELCRLLAACLERDKKKRPSIEGLLNAVSEGRRQLSS